MNESNTHAMPAPVFVVGAPRSGTTMLQYLLDDLPGLCMPTGESHFLIPLYRNASSFRDLDTRAGMRTLLETIQRFNPIFLAGDLHGITYDVNTLADRFVSERRTTVRDVVTGLFEANAAGLGKPRWGDKTPYYALHLEKLDDWWPDSKFIHLVRDGRDVALSLFGRKHDFMAYNIYHAAQYWQQYVDTARRVGARLGPERYLELRYEDILNDQPGALARICAFINEPCETGAATRVAQGESAKKLRTVDQSNQGKWQTRLTAWQVRVFKSEAGGTLVNSGYRCVTEPRRLPTALRGLYRFHNLLAMRLYRLLGKNRLRLNFRMPTPPAPPSA